MFLRSLDCKERMVFSSHAFGLSRVRRRLSFFDLIARKKIDQKYTTIKSRIDEQEILTIPTSI